MCPVRRPHPGTWAGSWEGWLTKGVEISAERGRNGKKEWVIDDIASRSQARGSHSLGVPLARTSLGWGLEIGLVNRGNWEASRLSTVGVLSTLRV